MNDLGEGRPGPEPMARMSAPGRAARLSIAARALILFWVGIGVILVAGAVTLQTLGPPLPPPERAAAAASPEETAPVARGTQAPPASPAEPAPPRPGRDDAGPVSAPDPGLLETTEQGMLPRVSVDGRPPMQVYARGFDRSTQRPRVGLLVAGLGPNEADSIDAAKTLPAAVTLAITPYAERRGSADPFGPLLDAIRLSGHEFLLSIPMEPANFPLNDPGDHALLTGATPEINARRLGWVMSRIEGYAGTTGALGPMRGERFELAGRPMQDVLRVLAERGLFFVDARAREDAATAALPDAWGRAVDLVVDEPAARPDVDGQLARLEGIARVRGSALGLVGVPRPVTVARIAQWASGLQERGLVLAPTSALMLRPQS